ncbi:MAG: PmoA family protein [Akkermansiaceae bacterium]
MTFLRTHFFFLTLALHVSAGTVVCEEGEDSIIISRNGSPVLTYHKTAKVPEGVDQKYARSGFIHPIRTPSGRVLTDDYPQPHHSHQNGVFLVWRKAKFEGKELNFWEPSAATVRHSKVLEIINGPDKSGFRVERAHVDGEKTILTEIWNVTVQAKTGHIDLHSEQRCATKSPLTLTRYHYGGMAIRGSRQWFPSAHTSAEKGASKDEFVTPCRMFTNEGLNEKTGNHSRPLWVCMTGPVDGADVSITLIPHPSNVRHPQHTRIHPKMPYFCILPSVKEPYTIEPNQPLLSRFRMIAQDGKPDPIQLNAAQQSFAGSR